MGEPIIKMDSGGKASIISYNVPEPTSYSGRNVIELDFDESIFSETAKAIPENRKVTLTNEELEAAIDTAADTGVLDEAIFPNAARRAISSRPSLRIRR